MRHFQNFDKIASFLKPFLNIFILGNLIIGSCEGLLKKGLVFCIKSIDLGGGGKLIVGRAGITKVRVGII